MKLKALSPRVGQLLAVSVTRHLMKQLLTKIPSA
jgi:hypothetical protein